MHINHHHFTELDSTQNRAREMIATHALPFIVTADTQTAGRGRQGRTWISPPGNFYASLGLRAGVHPNRYHEYSFVTALAVRDAVAEFADEKTTLKWPNDILLDGRKCAGILIESEGLENEFLIIGMGVNLHDAPEYGAVLFRGERVEGRAENFLSTLLFAFQSWHERYQSEGFGIIRSEWLRHAHALGQEIMARTPAEEIRGIFRGIDEQGSLLLTQNGATRKITAADVLL